MYVEHSQCELIVEQQKIITILQVSNAVLSNTVVQMRREISELRGQMSNMEKAAMGTVVPGAPLTAIAAATTASSACGSVNILENNMDTTSEEGFLNIRVGALEKAIDVLKVSNTGLLEKVAQMQSAMVEQRICIDEQRAPNDAFTTFNDTLRASVDELKNSIDQLRSSNDEQKASNVEQRFSNSERVISNLASRLKVVEMSNINLRKMLVDSQKSWSELRDLIITAASAPSTSSAATTTTVSSFPSTSMPVPSKLAATAESSAVADEERNSSSPSNTNPTVIETTSPSYETTKASSPLPASPANSAEHRKALSQDLFIAAKEGNALRVRHLVAEGANIEYRGKNGNTVLLEAAQGGHFDALKALIELGAPLEVVDVFQNTPVHLAVLSHHENCVKELLSAGAKVNIRNWVGVTPLHYAVGNNSQSIVEMLIAAGADCRVKDEDGKIPKDWMKSDSLRALL